MAANAVSQVNHLQDSPLDEDNTTKNLGQFDSSLIQAVAQEMMKIMKGKNTAAHQFDNMQSFAHFAGMINKSSHSGTCYAVQSDSHGSWIVDTGASDHMTYNLQTLTNVQPLVKPVHITLPDGSLKTVLHVGQVVLCPQLTLHNVISNLI